MKPADKRAIFAAANEILKSGWTKHDLAERRRLERAARLDKMRKKTIAALGSSPRPRCPAAEPDGVYVIGSPGGPVKVGITSDIRGRLQSLQTGCPDRLRVYLHIENLTQARAIERDVHSRLASSALTGEWFAIDWREAATLVRRVTDELATKPISSPNANRSKVEP